MDQFEETAERILCMDCGYYKPGESCHEDCAWDGVREEIATSLRKSRADGLNDAALIVGRIRKVKNHPRGDSVAFYRDVDKAAHDIQAGIRDLLCEQEKDERNS